jgi:preprotein translocase subunit SecA
VLARQAAEQAAAASSNGHGVEAPAATVTPAPATPSARRSGKKGQAAAAQAAPAPVEAAPSGLGGVKGLEPPTRSENLTYSAPSLDASAKESGPAKAAKTATVTGTKEPSRNAPCPCGSGKKYKVCHGRPGQSL